MRTFLRRPGNKSKHLRYIIPLLPDKFNVYIEPFLGSGALFLNILPEKWIINDKNKYIISIWQTVRDHPEYLLSQIKKFKKMFLPLNNDEKLLYCKKLIKMIDSFNPLKASVMYLLLIYCCISGNLERNNQLLFDSLYIDIYNRNTAHIFTEEYSSKIKELSKVLLNKASPNKIFNKDYKEILKKAKKNDFVFLDPPYLEDKTYAFQYNKDDQKKDVITLQEIQKELEKLDSKGVKWMMTQIDNEQVRKVFDKKKYNIHEYINKNCISVHSGNFAGKKELIITNY